MNTSRSEDKRGTVMQSDYRDSDSVMVLGSTSSWLYGGMVVVVDVPRLIYHRLVWMLPRVRIMFILDLSGSSFAMHIYFWTHLFDGACGSLGHFVAASKNVARRLCSVHKLTFALLLDW